MQLREKGKKDVVTMGWDEAQAALRTGNYEVVENGGTEEPAEGDDLDGLTKAELEDVAKERGVDISDAKTKAEIVAKLRA